MQWTSSYAARPVGPVSGSSTFGTTGVGVSSAAPYIPPRERPAPPARGSAYAPPLQRRASASAAESPSLPVHLQLRYSTPHYRSGSSRTTASTGYLPAAPPLRRWGLNNDEYPQYTSPFATGANTRSGGAAAAATSAPAADRWTSRNAASPLASVNGHHAAVAARSTLPSTSAATGEHIRSPLQPTDLRGLPTPANGALHSATSSAASAPWGPYGGGGSPAPSPAARALWSLPTHDPWGGPESASPRGGAAATAAVAWTFETPDERVHRSESRAVRQAMRLRLFDFAIASLDGAAAAAATGSATPLPLLLRGVVSGGSPLRFATEPEWPTAAVAQRWGDGGGAQRSPPSSAALGAAAPQRSASVTTCSVSWPSCVVEATVPVPADGTAAAAEAEDALSNGAQQEPREPLRTLVLECYAVAPPPPPQQRVGEEEERYLGRCHVPLSDVVASARGADAGEGATAQSVELTLRDSRGVSIGRVCFAAALRALVERTVRLSSVVVYPDPLQGARGGSGGGGGELELALLPPEPQRAQARSDDASMAAAALASADSRSATAVRWSVLPPVSYPGTDEEFDEGPGERGSASAVPPPPLLLRGCLYYCTYDRHSEVNGRGAMSFENGGSPHPQQQPRRVLLGTFAVPPPASMSARSSQGRNGHSPGQAPPPSYEFAAPLHRAGESNIETGVECWVRGVVETWISTPRPLVEGWAGQQMEGSPESWALSGDRRGSVPHPPLTPQPPTSGIRSAPPSPAAAGGAAGASGPSRSGPISLEDSPSPAGPVPLAHLSPAPPSPQEDAALQRVRERQEALIDRVEHRLAEVQERRRQLQAQMTAAAEQARQEENAIAEEYGLLESQLRDATGAYEAAAAELAELREYHASSTAQHDAYAAEQERALAEVARERQEALELREQLEALRAQMASHLEAERQRYAARVARAQAAAGQVEHNSRWLTEVEAKIAAAAAAAPAAAVPSARV